MGRSLLGGLSARDGREDEHGSASDPLLSTFLYSISYTVTRDDPSDNSCSINDVSAVPEAERYLIVYGVGLRDDVFVMWVC